MAVSVRCEKPKSASSCTPSFNDREIVFHWDSIFIMLSVLKFVTLKATSGMSATTSDAFSTKSFGNEKP